MLLNTEQVSEMIGASKGTVAEMARTGRIPAINIGHESGRSNWRFDQRAVREWLAKRGGAPAVNGAGAKAVIVTTLSSSEAGRILGMTGSGVCYLADRGKLPHTIETIAGRRVRRFRREDVERVASARNVLSPQARDDDAPEASGPKLVPPDENIVSAINALSERIALMDKVVDTVDRTGQIALADVVALHKKVDRMQATLDRLLEIWK